MLIAGVHVTAISVTLSVITLYASATAYSLAQVA